MPCLLLIGFTQSTSMVALAVILMRTSEPQYRGRVMGVRMLVIYGHPHRPADRGRADRAHRLCRDRDTIWRDRT